MTFEERLDKLNASQRRAVDTLDGPVMVIAGPGTGKTELLGMRAANILQKTDVLPENILCLTFTDAGSIAMQKRLRDIIGRDAARVSIFTFHSFGTEIMGRYRQYFYNGADFTPADDLERHRILTEILDELKEGDPLKSRMNGQYTSISDILGAISDLKRAGLTDSEFQILLDASQGTIDIANKLLKEVFAGRVAKGTIGQFDEALEQIKVIDEATPMSDIGAFRDVLVRSMQYASVQSAEHPKLTPPITEWKKQWLTADYDKSQVLKVAKDMPKLRSLCYVYGKYLETMQKRELLDYDDMIMQVVHAIEVNDDLRYDLQEKYQYIMVDEFQDTNLAQMRILHNLTDNEVNEGNPNILVVGDDDQAIYGFQGADVGNILSFRDTYASAKFITLTENYRSVQPVLDGAREVIIQGDERLERRIPELDKSLVAKSSQTPENLEIVQHTTSHLERDWVAKSVRKLLDSGVKPSEIAIIARKHADLVSMLSYLTDSDIPISYDRRDNILDDEVVQVIELLARIVHNLGIINLDLANSLMPELLAHPAMGIKPETLWEISLASYKNNDFWLVTLGERPDTKDLYNWIIAAAKETLHLPLERMLDVLIGNTTVTEEYTSPIKTYFFGTPDENTNLAAYTKQLENLSTLRRHLREHTKDASTARIGDLLEFIDENRETKTEITSYRHIGTDEASVQLMSAHGSKGLEFDHVFILNATDTMWGEKARSRSGGIAFPPHLRLQKNTGSYDERLRLFYVAMTRARRGLHVSYATENDDAKETLMASFLLGNPIKLSAIEDSGSLVTQQEAAEHKWYAPIVNVPKITMRDYLAPVMNSYKLSATHVNNFIDVPSGGPQHFLLNSLLRFPSAPSASASYGTVVHNTLQKVHDHLASTGSLLPEEDVVNLFETQLARLAFTNQERKMYTQKGCEALQAFMRAKGDSFNPAQKAEINFSNQGVLVGEAKLTGKLDVVEFDKTAKTAIVTDYKTGKSLTDWGKGSDFDKVKSHKYRQQLLFYKLLVEQSRDWHDYHMTQGVLQFVEPDKAGAINDLTINDIDSEELERFKNLISGIWKLINNQIFPDTSGYEQNIKGIIAFEDDILTGKYL